MDIGEEEKVLGESMFRKRKRGTCTTRDLEARAQSRAKTRRRATYGAMDAVANSCSSCSLLQLQAAVLRWPPGRECLGGSGRDGMELWLMEAWSSGEAQAAGQRLGAFLVLVACLVSRRQQCDGLQEATVPTRRQLPRGVL